MYSYRTTYDDGESTSYESFAPPLPSEIAADQAVMVESSCSSSSSSSRSSSSSSMGTSKKTPSTSESTEDSSFLSAASSTIVTEADESQTAFRSENDEDELTNASSSFWDHYYKEGAEPPAAATSASSISTNDDSTSSSTSTSTSKQTTTSSTKLSLRLDDVRHMARLGRNATIRHRCRLPTSVTKADIHVQVDIDERASSERSRHLEEVVIDSIRDDLMAVYSADADSAKLILCIVIVVLVDGSFLRTLTDRDGVIGLAEIGLVWRLFEADDLTVYDGGLVVQREEVAHSLLDFLTLTNRGRLCLLNRLVPRVANDIMSRIADANDELLVEI